MRIAKERRVVTTPLLAQLVCERIFSVEIGEKKIRLTEECDRAFFVYLTPEELKALAQELINVANLIQMQKEGTQGI